MPLFDTPDVIPDQKLAENFGCLPSQGRQSEVNRCWCDLRPLL
jgi:hypothetical protein